MGQQRRGGFWRTQGKQSFGFRRWFWRCCWAAARSIIPGRYAQSGARIPAKDAYINVVYLTDREVDAKAAGGFGTNWADAASCGTAEARIPPARLPGEEKRWGYVVKTWPHACAAKGSPLGGVMAEIEAQAKARHCDSVFLYIHGFHTGFDGAVLRAAQMSHDAQTGCAVATFSWSSEVELGRYVPAAGQVPAAAGDTGDCGGGVAFGLDGLAGGGLQRLLDAVHGGHLPEATSAGQPA